MDFSVAERISPRSSIASCICRVKFVVCSYLQQPCSVAYIALGQLLLPPGHLVPQQPHPQWTGGCAPEILLPSGGLIPGRLTSHKGYFFACSNSAIKFTQWESLQLSVHVRARNFPNPGILYIAEKAWIRNSCLIQSCLKSSLVVQRSSTEPFVTSFLGIRRACTSRPRCACLFACFFLLVSQTVVFDVFAELVVSSETEVSAVSVTSTSDFSASSQDLTPRHRMGCPSLRRNPVFEIDYIACKSLAFRCLSIRYSFDIFLLPTCIISRHWSSTEDFSVDEPLLPSLDRKNTRRT